MVLPHVASDDVVVAAAPNDGVDAIVPISTEREGDNERERESICVGERKKEREKEKDAL